jgi:hypothetical protein
LHTVRNHFKTIYPGSTHYAPEKVTIGKPDKNVGEINIDVPGVTRAYHNITIVPKRANYLTIPIHRAAYGLSAKSFPDLFIVRKKNGSAFLARQLGKGSL